MTLKKRRLLQMLIVIGAFIVGFGGGVAFTAHKFQKYIFGRMPNGQAAQLAEHVNQASFMRIGDSSSALKQLEIEIDNESMGLMSFYDNPSRMPPDILSALRQYRTYRKIYASPAKVNAPPWFSTSLASIMPIEDYKNGCGAGLCQLMELRDSKTTSTLERTD